jgi:general secretion pathway protein I
MKRRIGNLGFTLIEVMIAMFILAGGILVISNAWSGNFMRMRKSALFNDVATLLERKMLETEAKYKLKQLAEIPDAEEGDFGSDFPQYHWRMKSHDLKLPDLTPLLIGQQEGADEMLIGMVKQVTEFLSQAIKEVQVTVFVKARTGKELQFSAVQYFMDFTKEFGGGLGGPGGAAGGAAPPANNQAAPPPTPGPTGAH